MTAHRPSINRIIVQKAPPNGLDSPVCSLFDPDLMGEAYLFDPSLLRLPLDLSSLPQPHDFDSAQV
jgi:hypothetical protein